MALSLVALYTDVDGDDHHMAGEFATDALVRSGSLHSDIANLMDEIITPEAKKILVKWYYSVEDDVVSFKIWFDEDRIDELTGLDSV